MADHEKLGNIRLGSKTDQTHSKNKKHNAKRRQKKKKSEQTVDDKVTDVVNFLCDTLKNDSSKDNVSSSEAQPSSSGMTKELDVLLENLQVHTDKNPIKQTNVTDFLNVNLLKQTKGEVLKLEELERIKKERLKKKSEKTEVVAIPKEKLKEYFNVNLIQNCPDKTILKHIESSSIKLVSDIESTVLASAKSQPKQGKYVSEYFNVNATENILTSIQSTSQNLVHELKGVISENIQKTQNQKVKEKKKNQKKSSIQTNSKEENVFRKHFTPSEIKTYLNFGFLISGVLRINPKNFREAYINAPDKGLDILIEGLKDRNRALEGDEVYLMLRKEEEFSQNNGTVQRTAVVVAIKCKNHGRTAIGSLKTMPDNNPKYALFSPRDSRLPRIQIPRANWPKGFAEKPKSFQDMVYLAKIVEWNDVRFAKGEIIEEIGLAGDVAVETKALLLKNGLNTTPYPESMNQFFPSSPYHVTEQVVKCREDLRAECIFTIDPATAKDLDDAVSLKYLDNGNLEVGVHISDVAYFLAEGTPLDEAVSQRATTIYLVQEVHHMLPRELCLMCSLTPGEDKLAFSVIWELTPEFKFVRHRFARTVINSCAKLSYEHAQHILDGGDGEEIAPLLHGQSVEKVKETILSLNRLAVTLRGQRFENGALSINQVKISFDLDEQGLPEGFSVYVNMEAHRLIEELMLLANITTAQHILEVFPQLAFLRCHSEPLPFILEKLQQVLEKFGVILDISSSGKIHKSLSRYSGPDLHSVARSLVLSNVLAKPMARARYYCAQFNLEELERRHYALNVPLYTHFTSPIRRYADIMVHRLLAASLGYTESPQWTPDYVQTIASNCNKQKYGAKMAGEQSTELFLTIWVGLRGAVIETAVVCDVKDKSFDCIVLATGSHHRVYYESIEAERRLKDSDGVFVLHITWPASAIKNTEKQEQVVEMFSLVQIELRRGGLMKLDARLIPSAILPF